MTENVTTVTGVGATLPSNTTIGADNISSVYYERVKIAQGDTGTAVDVSSGAPLWVNVATTGNILGTFTTSTGTIGAVLQGTSPWVTSPSSQWTVSVTPTTQFSVITTPSSQATVSVQPTTQWTVSVTPTTQFTVTTTPSSQAQVSAIPDTNLIMNGTSSLTPVIVPIATLSSSGLNAVVTAPTSGTVRVLSMFLVAAGAVNIQWMSSSTTTTTGSVWTGITALSSNAGYVLPYNPVGWLATTTGTGVNGLYANLSAPVQVGGSLTYINV